MSYQLSQSNRQWREGDFLGRDNTRIMKYINTQFEIMGVDKIEVYNKTFEILSMYRELCWFTKDRLEDVINEISELGNYNLTDALIVLEIFASGEKRRKIRDNTNSLFYTKRLIDIVDKAILQLKKFPRDGDQYYKIINDNFLSSEILPQAILEERSHYTRSEYYQKRKEAIYLVALNLWK